MFISDTSPTHTMKSKKDIHPSFGSVSVATRETDLTPRSEAAGSALVEVLLRQRKPVLLQSFDQKPCSN